MTKEGLVLLFVEETRQDFREQFVLAMNEYTLTVLSPSDDIGIIKIVDHLCELDDEELRPGGFLGVM